MDDGNKQAIYLDAKTRQVNQESWKTHPFVEELGCPGSGAAAQNL